MATSQKDQNRVPLMLVLTVNAAAFLGLVTNQQADPAAWFATLDGNLRGSFPVTLALVLTGVLNSQLSPLTKARLVFLDWDHPLPGSRAFSKYVSMDPRTDAEALERKYGPFPTEPEDQNKRWYGIYRGVRDEPSVVDASKGYLFGRDYASMMVLAGLLFGGLSLLLQARLHRTSTGPCGS